MDAVLYNEIMSFSSLCRDVARAFKIVALNKITTLVQLFYFQECSHFEFLSSLENANYSNILGRSFRQLLEKDGFSHIVTVLFEIANTLCNI